MCRGTAVNVIPFTPVIRSVFRFTDFHEAHKYSKLYAGRCWHPISLKQNNKCGNCSQAGRQAGR